jgi:hypothetical protein
MRRIRVLILSVIVGMAYNGLSATAIAATKVLDTAPNYIGDGRMPQAQLFEAVTTGLGKGWQRDTAYAYPDDASLAIKAWRTRQTGPALWILSGVHGEESAGPNAIARNIAVIAELAEAGIPIVLIPISNPKAYRNNWRYPNTAERDWKSGGGYSVGDSEYLLPDLESGTKPRVGRIAGPETLAFTSYVLTHTRTYPPALVLDLHEDEQSVDGGYIYSQGKQADANPVGSEIVRALQSAGIKLRMSGNTRFGEPIVAGVISRDDKGDPIRDGSIDELLAADTVFIDGIAHSGPAAKTVIVVETPADASVSFEQRVDGQGEVLRRLPQLWKLNQEIPTD